MRYVHQIGPTCLLASICQIDESLNYMDLLPGYTVKSQDAFVKKLYPRSKFAENFAQHAYNSYLYPVKEPNLKDKGVITLALWGDKERHAVSYENGKILDPAGSGVTETISELLNRRINGHKIRIINITKFIDSTRKLSAEERLVQFFERRKQKGLEHESIH